MLALISRPAEVLRLDSLHDRVAVLRAVFDVVPVFLRARVSRCARVEDAVIAMGFSKSKLNLEKSLPHVIRLSRRAMKIRIMGSAALELAYVACGRLDAYVERTINLWDIAAGALLVECAGGEFYTRPAPGGKFRMVADNGRLRKKLQVGSLLK